MKIFTLNQEKEITRLYQQGLSICKLEKIHCCSDSVIVRILKKHKITIRTHRETNKKYLVRSNFFKNINSHAKAYILGLFITDGYNRETHGYAELGLHIQDKYLLEYVSKMIHKNYRPVYLKKGGQFCYTFFTDKMLSEDLAKLECVQKKSLIVRYPKIDDKFSNSFILGCFDGDGCISNKVFSICSGSQKFCIDLQRKLWQLLTIYRKNHLLLLKKWLYANQKIFLKRKKRLFDAIK